jgi:hypothetical protein
LKDTYPVIYRAFAEPAVERGDESIYFALDSGSPSVVKGNCKFSGNYGVARHGMQRTRQGNFTADMGLPDMEQLLRDLDDARKDTAFGLLRRREQYDAPYVRGDQNLWPICGQNSQHSSVRGWQRMGKNCKSLDFPWWLQLLKRQILTFLPVV